MDACSQTLLHDLIPETKEVQWLIKDDWTPLLKSSSGTLYLDTRTLEYPNGHRQTVFFELHWLKDFQEPIPAPTEEFFSPWIMILKNCKVLALKGGPLKARQDVYAVEMNYKEKVVRVWQKKDDHCPILYEIKAKMY